MNKELIELFREYFDYADGRLIWIKSSGTRGLKGHFAGKLRKDGYYDVGLKGKYYLVHRVIYALHNNELPDVVDHINRQPFDNRIENLRAADFIKNAHNSKRNVKNSLGVKGVRKTKNNKYEARIATNGVTIQVGTFDTLKGAAEALKKVRQKEHEEFACDG